MAYETRRNKIKWKLSNLNAINWDKLQVHFKSFFIPGQKP